MVPAGPTHEPCQRLTVILVSMSTSLPCGRIAPRWAAHSVGSDELDDRRVTSKRFNSRTPIAWRPTTMRSEPCPTSTTARETAHLCRLAWLPVS